MRKRYYIFIVTHDWDGQLRRMPIPVLWVVLFVAFALVGAGTLAGLAGSYTRMWAKVQHFNELRSRQELLTRQLDHERHEAEQSRAEVASLGTLATEVSALYNLTRNPSIKDKLRPVASDAPDAFYDDSLNNFQVLESSALNGALATPVAGSAMLLNAGLWRPSLWPVRGRITSSFGERMDPFNGEGAFHSGLDIAVSFGTPVHASAAGEVVYSGFMNGYGRTIIINHGHGLRTLYAHMSALAVTIGQHVQRDEVVGFVGMSGRSTGAHLHYEVRINNAPVNPIRYLR